jgi:gentisate 1,2-dioxygenase
VATKAGTTTQTKTQYDTLIELSDETRRRAQSGAVVVHTKDLVLEDVPGRKRRRAFISEPAILGSMVQTMGMFIAEIAPGDRTGRHRHFNEAMIYIISGRGHTIIVDKRYDWSEADVISVPLYEWHQHFNDDPDKPVRYLGVTNLPLLRAMGLNRLEDSPDA